MMRNEKSLKMREVKSKGDLNTGHDFHHFWKSRQLDPNPAGAIHSLYMHLLVEMDDRQR